MRKRISWILSALTEPLAISRMKIALIGYGKMGHTIERVAMSRGHEIVCVVDVDSQTNFATEAFASADVAIEFTTPLSAVSNIRKAWEADVPVVSGTTGWHEQLPMLKEELNREGKGLFWSSNYSIGVNLFMEVNRQLASMMNKYESYAIRMSETHHIHKLDAPSGTAITLAEDILERVERKRGWELGTEVGTPNIPIESIREGEVPGVHTVTYESDVDSITISHSAKSREGLALGAVLAAEFMQGRKGYYTMRDMLSL